MLTTLFIGQAVSLIVPDNPILHGKPATIEAVTSWGAHVLCGAAATGRFRALHSEMIEITGAELISMHGESRDVPDLPALPAGRHGDRHGGRHGAGPGYEGQPCDRCGSLNLVRTGTCLTCLDCGTTGGC